MNNSIENNKGIKIDRSSVYIRENEYIKYKNEIYKIISLLDFEEAVGVNIKNKRAKKIEIKKIKPISDNDVKNDNILKDISQFTDEEFKEIKKKYLAIHPILSGEIRRKDIDDYAKKTGFHFTTLYRWVENYKSTGTLLGLLPKKSGRRKGETRLNPMTEEVIQNVIEIYYLVKQKPSVQSIINKVNMKCKELDITPPGKNTVRNRINEISKYELLKKQGEKSKARTNYMPTPGSFEADYPMQLVEIDHTPVDLILVDDETREPIGRPWLTLAIDIYSRMIVGYYLSLNPPSSTSVAMCVANIILPKDKLLIELDVDSNWDVWGFPQIIHVDNGADFRSEAVKAAGLAHGINIEFRPVGKANFGGHIERVIGTMMKAVHEIPGTTFSNIRQRGEYDSSKNSVMTFLEFEKWIVTFITKVYHKRKHRGISTTPEYIWREGIFGENSPMGLPPKPSDFTSIILDFLPIFKRTIQKNGVNIEGLNYYDNLLRTKINTIDNNTGKKKQFIFKRDPRNIKYVWFYDDDTKEYYKIPTADQSIPELTLWEYELIKKRIKEKGEKVINTDQILEAHRELHEQIEKATKKSKKARRMKQRLNNTKKEISNYKKEAIAKIPDNIIDISEDDNLWDDNIPDFDK